MTEQLLAPLHPDENALTLLFQANFDDSMLREIAEADYGWEADECYVFLLPILNLGIVASDDFQLREVLELTRWSEPEDPEWGPGGHGTRGHWMRLFACATLLRLAQRYPTKYDTECDTLAQLTASAIQLGEPVARAAASLLAWRFLTSPGEEENPLFLAFAILLLATHLERGEDRGPWLKQLAAWVEEEESRVRHGFPACEWRFGLTGPSQREAVWRALAKRILACPETPHPREADEALRLLGEYVVDD